MLLGLQFHFLMALAISVLLVVLIVPVLRRVWLYFKGSPGGWNLLADYFATSPAPRGEILQNQSIVAGRVPYFKCVTVGIGDEGLYVTVARPNSPSLFIPWSEFRIFQEVRIFGYEVILVSLRNPIVGTITLPASLFSKCSPHLPNLKRKSRRSKNSDCGWFNGRQGNSHSSQTLCKSTDRPTGSAMPMRRR